jgi:hypothetical protein
MIATELACCEFCGEVVALEQMQHCDLCAALVCAPCGGSHRGPVGRSKLCPRCLQSLYQSMERRQPQLVGARRFGSDDD